MSADARAAQLVVEQANHFSLSGGHIHVDYASTSFTSQPRLTYHDPVRNLSFSGADIRTVAVADIGTIVSITLSITPDVGSTTFSVLIPRVIVSGPGGSNPVATEGLTTTHSTPFAPQIPGQREKYRVVRLTGTANFLVF